MTNVEREYEYKPKWMIIVFGAVFFSLCAALLGNKASTNKNGLIINHLIELGPTGATVFFWILTALSFGIVAINGFLLYHRLTYDQRILIGSESMIVPAARWSKEDAIEICYSSIRELATTKIYGQRFLYITHGGGKYTIMASMLPSRATFDDLSELLIAKVQNSRIAR